MAGPKFASETGDIRFPATTGTTSGVIGIALVAFLVVLIAVDSWDLVGVRIQLGLLILGALAWALMLRPRISVKDGVLRLVNPFHTVSIPLQLVDRAEVRSVTKVHVGRRTYIGIAVGRRTRDLVRGNAGGIGPDGPFGYRTRGTASQRDQTADLLEDVVERSAGDARSEARRLGTDDAKVERVRNWPLFAALGVLVVALVVTLVL